MVKFKKYGSIKNVNSEKGKATILIFGDVPAVALEKAHGAHFSFQTDGDIVECARRGDVLSNDDNFYDFQLLLERYSQVIKTIFEMVKASSIQVDGELIGGTYKHPKVKARDVSPIQSGVYYSPKYEFYAYDILCFYKDVLIFVNYDKSIEIFKKVGLLYAEPIARGTFKELCGMSNVFPSRISTCLGLPEIDNNDAEGLVIKPINDIRLENGSRVILKSKNNKFCETNDIRKSKKPRTSLESKLDENVLDCLDSMTTENRLNNVISKIGPVTKADFGRLMKDLNLDILEEFKDEYKTIYDTLNKETFPIAKKYLNMQCSLLIKRYLSIL